VRSGVQSAHVVYTMSAGDLRADGTVTPANRVVLGMTEVSDGLCKRWVLDLKEIDCEHDQDHPRRGRA
jgi:hypothetical protein